MPATSSCRCLPGWTSSPVWRRSSTCIPMPLSLPRNAIASSRTWRTCGRSTGWLRHRDRNFSDASIWFRTAPGPWSPCAATCYRCCGTIPGSGASTRICDTCLFRGSTRVSSSCARSTGRHRRWCWRKSSTTRPCTRSTAGMTCAVACVRIGAVLRSSIPPLPMTRWCSWKLP